MALYNSHQRGNIFMVVTTLMVEHVYNDYML